MAFTAPDKDRQSSGGFVAPDKDRMVLLSNQTNEQIDAQNAERIAQLFTPQKQKTFGDVFKGNLAQIGNTLATGSAADIVGRDMSTPVGGVLTTLNEQITLPNFLTLGMLPRLLAAREGAGALVNAATRAGIAHEAAAGLGQSEGARTANQPVPYFTRPEDKTFNIPGGERSAEATTSILNALGILGMLHGGNVPQSKSGLTSPVLAPMTEAEWRANSNPGADRFNVMQDPGRMLISPEQAQLNEFIRQAQEKQNLASGLLSPSKQLPSPRMVKLNELEKKVEASQVESSKPPFIAGMVTPTLEEGIMPVTAEMLATKKAPVLTKADLKPALMIDDKPVIGGESHTEIANKIRQAAGDDKDLVVKALEAQLDDSKHVFVDKEGKVYSRTEASQALGIDKPLHSEMLKAPESEPAKGTKLYGGIPFLDFENFDLKKIINDVATRIGSSKIVDTLSYMKDATSNLVAKNANEAASTISGMLERSTKQKDSKNSLDRQALTFVIESEGDKAKLAEMRDKLLKSTTADKRDKAEALYAINYAEHNWDKLNPVAEHYNKLTEAEAKSEESSGRVIERRRGYVMHLAEDTGDASSFTHMREFDTMADRIAAGVPKGSLDSVELLRSRIARGQQMYVQNRVFIDNVKKLKDAKGNSIIGEYEKLPRTAGRGTPDYRVPKGYEEVKIGYNTVPVLKAYASTLQALTNPSWFAQGALGRSVLELRGIGKHIALGFDTFHAVRLATYGAMSKLGSLKNPVLHPSKGNLLLDNSVEELTAKANAGQIDKAQLPEMLEAKRKLDLGVKTGFNVNRVIDAFNQHWTEKIPVSGHFQHWLFNNFQRGVMADVYTTCFDVYKAQMPTATDAGVARKLSADLNDVFGTRGRQGWVKSRTGQDAMSLLFLAPQWTEGRIVTEAKALGGTAKAGVDLLQGKKPAVNMQTRVVGTTILMTLLANQVINTITTGHDTFDNEEGHQLDAFIPDKIGGSEGYWLNPTANAMEVLHTFSNSLEREGGDVWQAWLDFLGGRLSTVTRPLGVGITGKQYGITGPDVPPVEGEKAKFGHPSGQAKFEAMVKTIVPSPIGGPELVKAFKGERDASTEKQLFSRAGIKLDSAAKPKEGKKNRKQRYSIIR